MGGCHCNHPPILAGIVLPEQESAINESEWSHPFASYKVSTLFSELSVHGIEGVLTSEQLADLAASFKLSTAPSYLPALTGRTGEINIKHLILSAMLLGKGTFERKLQLSLSLYQRHSGLIYDDEFISFLEDTVYIATEILPSMTQQNVEFYLIRIRTAVTSFIEMTLRKVFHKPVLTVAQLLRRFKEHPAQKKICWANGIRMTLIENDLNPSKLSQRRKSPNNFSRVIHLNSTVASFTLQLETGTQENERLKHLLLT